METTAWKDQSLTTLTAQIFQSRVKLVTELYTWFHPMTPKAVVRKFKLLFQRTLHPAGSHPFSKTQGAAQPSAPSYTAGVLFV